MPEGAEGNQPHEEALQKDANGQASALPENTESNIEQKTQQEAKLWQENAKDVLGKIDALPEKPTLSEKAQEKIDQVRKKYEKVKEKIIGWTALGYGVTGNVTMASAIYGLYETPSRETAQWIMPAMIETLYTEAGVAGAMGLTAIVGAKAIQKTQEWKTRRDVAKEIQNEAPKEAQK